MNLFKYIYKSFSYYRRKHLTILLGTILSTAILTGALIVGDSVKFSLYRLVNKRLGNIEFVLKTGERFVTNELPKKIADKFSTKAAGLLQLEGIAINSDEGKRLNRVNIYGIDKHFAQLTDADFPNFNDNELLINENAANRLNIKQGDELLIRINQVELIPVNTTFSQESSPTIAFRLRVKQILDDNQFGRFSLKSDQKAPYNIWISKEVLWNKLSLNNKINTILISNNGDEINTNYLNEALKNIWSLGDASINLKQNNNYIEITSNRIFIDNPFVSKIEDEFKAQGILTYLVNSLSTTNAETPYSFVTGVSNKLTNRNLSADDIILNDWCANDLNVEIGDSVTLNYFIIGHFRKLQTASKVFIVKDILPNQKGIFSRNLTPDFPGLSDAESCSEWDTGVPIDLSKIRDKDETYWNNYKGTPKAIINLKSAQLMWGNQFGENTALRINNTNINIRQFSSSLAKVLNPKDIGLQFVNIKDAGNQAIVKAVDFGELFLSLSFFVIAAGILLLILLYALNIFSRKFEIGVLSALGFSKNKILKLFLMESSISIIIGGFVGAIVGIFYNKILITGLNSVWHDAVRTNALEIVIKPQTLFIGFISSIIIAFIVILIISQKLISKSITTTIKGVNNTNSTPTRNAVVAFLFLIISFSLVVYSIASHQVQNAALFLSAGGVLLISLISFVGFLLKKQVSIIDVKVFTISKLAIKNLSRQRLRSLMAISLLALGTFSVIITGANRKTFHNADNQRQSGTGGFMYWVENSIPIIHNLNSVKGQQVFNMSDEPIVDSIEFIQFLSLNGNDASCLNLNQVENPQILGVPVRAFNNRKAFSFAGLITGVDNKNPWAGLEKEYGENIIPAYADQTVITWGLMKKIGDTLVYRDEFGEKLNIIIAGGLNSSVFQGSILISDKNFRKYFPNSAGSKTMLIDAPNSDSKRVAAILDNYFTDYGVDYSLTTTRLQEFNSVTNTYLNVFMLLGGLGVIIGTIGFGVILLRNRLERKGEIALLSAIGIQNKQLFRLIFIEHFMLLVIGLSVGVISAFVGILPSVLLPTYSIPVAFVMLLIGLILFSGLFWIWLSAKSNNKINIMDDLRTE